MKFGNRVRALRESTGFTQAELAERMSVSVSYISKVENERLQFGDYPSEKFLRKLAVELKADVDELMLLTNRVPDSIRKRVCERPDAFRKLAAMDDRTIDRILKSETSRDLKAKKQ
ncbi:MULTISPECIES: helix-turn-helix domain-containing protein [Rhodopirellula]|uniref:helix-turn-helix domain-containing protein n=1 Tax=Rhodopirellula TaxID=265488 RepID=UPI002580348C|nr:helix-turn-helix transcriptional regulator [Rhodopirellula sp. UBA1907]